MSPGEKREQIRQPGIVTALRVVAMLEIIAGGFLCIGLLGSGSERVFGAVGISGIIAGIFSFGFAAVIGALNKANVQREHIADQLRENAKALQWLIDNHPK